MAHLSVMLCEAPHPYVSKTVASLAAALLLARGFGEGVLEPASGPFAAVLQCHSSVCMIEHTDRQAKAQGYAQG